ncbi:hypothetical protein LP421_19950 [Rhizobium sp. RCAM05350]|nr:hypothetical protein LP421_19950 [Rhizobium sp. RCAM05350]
MTEKKPLAVRPGSFERRLPSHQPMSLNVSPLDLEFEQLDNRSPLRRLVIAGIATILVSFGGFLPGRFLTELSSATVANGTVIVDSEEKDHQPF